MRIIGIASMCVDDAMRDWKLRGWQFERMLVGRLVVLVAK